MSRTAWAITCVLAVGGLALAGRAVAGAPVATRPATEPGPVLLHSSEPVHALAVSPDGTLIVVGTLGTSVRVYSTAADGKEVGSFDHGNWVCEELQFSADGSVLMGLTWDGLFGGVKHVAVWRVRDGKRLFSTRDLADDDPLSRPFTGELSPDGKRVAVGGGWFKGIYAVELATGARTHLLPDLVGPSKLRFNGDSFTLTAWTSDVPDPDAVAVAEIDVRTGRARALHKWEQGEGIDGVRPVEGRLLSRAKQSGAIGWTDLTSGRWVPPASGETSVGDAAVLVGTPDGGTVVAATSTEVVVWNLKSGEWRVGHVAAPAAAPAPSAPSSGPVLDALTVRDVAVSADGAVVVTSDKAGLVRVWRTGSLEVRKRPPSRTP